MRAYTVEMHGPEWTVVLGVFVGPGPGGLSPEARAAALRDKLEARDPDACRRIPWSHRTGLTMELSRFVTVCRRVE